MRGDDGIYDSPFSFSFRLCFHPWSHCTTARTACGWVGTGHVNGEGAVEKRVSLQWKTGSRGYLNAFGFSVVPCVSCRPSASVKRFDFGKGEGHHFCDVGDGGFDVNDGGMKQTLLGRVSRNPQVPVLRKTARCNNCGAWTTLTNQHVQSERQRRRYRHERVTKTRYESPRHDDSCTSRTGNRVAYRWAEGRMGSMDA